MSKLRFATAALFFVVASAFAQEYPARPVVMLVPFAAGGPTDTVARSLAQGMGKALKQTMVVENAVGAGGTIAPSKLKGAAADGYTIMLAHIGMSTAPALYRQLSFKPLEDFELIGQVVDVPMTLIGKQDLAPKDLKELIVYLKANIPYKGTAPAINDILGGQVDILCDQTTNTTQYIKAGRVKAYGTTSSARLDSLRELPTLSEAGVPGFEVVVWHGVYAPKGTPKPVVDKLIVALQSGIQDSAFVQRMSDLGSQVVPLTKATPASLRDRLKTEIDKWTPIIRKAGVYAD